MFQLCIPRSYRCVLRETGVGWKISPVFLCRSRNWQQYLQPLAKKPLSFSFPPPSLRITQFDQQLRILSLLLKKKKKKCGAGETTRRVESFNSICDFLPCYRENGDHKRRCCFLRLSTRLLSGKRCLSPRKRKTFLFWAPPPPPPELAPWVLGFM